MSILETFFIRYISAEFLFSCIKRVKKAKPTEEKNGKGVKTMYGKGHELPLYAPEQYKRAGENETRLAGGKSAIEGRPGEEKYCETEKRY